jgi:hypothetical protein
VEHLASEEHLPRRVALRMAHEAVSLRASRAEDLDERITVELMTASALVACGDHERVGRWRALESHRGNPLTGQVRRFPSWIHRPLSLLSNRRFSD